MKRWWISVLEGVAIGYLIRQSFWLFKETDELKKEVLRQRQMSDLFRTLIDKRGCGAREYFEAHGIRSIAVYGTGRVYRAIAEELAESADIRYFIDKKSQRKEIGGKPVVRAESIKQMEPVDGIVVTAVGFFHEIEEAVGAVDTKVWLIDIEDIVYHDRAKRVRR